MFAGIGIKIVSGVQFLGGFIGENSLTVLFASIKVHVWFHSACQLADVSVSQA